MKYTCILALLLCIACKRSPQSTVGVVQPEIEPQIGNPVGPVKLDTNYFDSLKLTHRGVSRYVYTSPFLTDGKEGIDYLHIDIRRNNSGTDTSHYLYAECDKFSFVFKMQDSLKKTEMFTLKQVKGDTIETFSFDNYYKNEIGWIRSSRVVSYPNDVKREWLYYSLP